MKFSPISVLSQIQNLVSKKIYNDIALLLYPCCKPTLEVGADFACTGNSYTVFGDVKVTYPQGKNKNATLIFTFTQEGEDDYSSALNVTLDSNGVWDDDDVVMYHWVADGVVNITVSVVVEESQVAVTSIPITITGVPNCD